MKKKRVLNGPSFQVQACNIHTIESNVWPLLHYMQVLGLTTPFVVW